jgi:hypothetical protein
MVMLRELMSVGETIDGRQLVTSVGPMTSGGNRREIHAVKDGGARATEEVSGVEQGRAVRLPTGVLALTSSLSA